MTIRTVSCVLAGGIALAAAGFVSAQDKAAPQGLMAFGGDSARMQSRVFFFDPKAQSSPGQFSFDYGQPAWKPEYDAMFDKIKGTRQRLGKDAWTTFETNVALSFGGKDVAPGQYCVAIECSKEGAFSLVLLDAKDIRAQKMDAFQSSGTKGGIIIPLTYEKTTTTAEKLTLQLMKGETDPKSGKFEGTWGNHKVSAPVVAQIQSA